MSRRGATGTAEKPQERRRLENRNRLFYADLGGVAVGHKYPNTAVGNGWVKTPVKLKKFQSGLAVVRLERANGDGKGIDAIPVAALALTT